MMQVRSFTQMVSSSGRFAIFLVNAMAEGKAAWYYLKVSNLKKPIFEKAVQQSGGADLSTLGDIVFKGWGEGPPADIQQRIQDEYGS